jgi:hypothetical protein
MILNSLKVNTLFLLRKIKIFDSQLLLIALEMRPIAKQISVMNRIAIVEYKIAL